MCAADDRGFTLVEALIALFVGVAMVVGLGLVAQTVQHQRATADANSTATALATRKIEELLALPAPGTQAALRAGTYGGAIDEQGAASVGGPYSIAWEVVDDTPYAGSKKITVTVTNLNSEMIHARLVTYYKF